MKALRLPLFVLAAAIALNPPAVQSKDVQKETAYERVLRTGTLRCGYIPWPNFFEKDSATGTLRGFYKDVTDEVLDTVGLKAEYVEVNLGQQAADLQSGKIDAMCGEGPWMVDVVKYITFSDPIAYMPVYVYGRKNAVQKDFNTEAASFVGIDGDLSTQLAQRHFPKAKLSTLSNMSNASNLFMDVATNKADFAIVDTTSAAVFEQSNPGVIRMIGNAPLAIYPVGFATAKGEDALLSTLSEAVQAAHNTRLIEEMMADFDPQNRLVLRVPGAIDSVQAYR